MKNLIENGTLFIEEGTIEIQDRQFYENDDIVNVILPESLEIIGEEAFAYCHNLKEIILPNNLKIIKAGAFFENTSLSNVILNDGLQQILDGAFLSCSLLKNIIIPSTVKVIPTMCFYGCDLKNITLDENIEQVDDQAFWNNVNLKEVNILNKNVRLGLDLFGCCESLKQGYIACGYPDEMELSDFVFYTILALTSFEKHREDIQNIVKENALENEKILMETIIKTNNSKALNTLIKYDLIKGNIDEYIECTLRNKHNELTALLLQSNQKMEDFEL